MKVFRHYSRKNTGDKNTHGQARHHNGHCGGAPLRRRKITYKRKHDLWRYSGDSGQELDGNERIELLRRRQPDATDPSVSIRL